MYTDINLRAKMPDDIDTRSDAHREAAELMKKMGITSDWVIENIKEVAMSRFNVKKSKRPHIKRILDDAFEQLKERDYRDYD